MIINKFGNEFHQMNRSFCLLQKKKKEDPDPDGGGALREGVIALMIRKNEMIKNTTVLKPNDEGFGLICSAFSSFYDFTERSDLLRC